MSFPDFLKGDGLLSGKWLLALVLYGVLLPSGWRFVAKVFDQGDRVTALEVEIRGLRRDVQELLDIAHRRNPP